MNVGVLGRVVSREGVTINPKNMEVVHKWPTPKYSKDVEKLMGNCDASGVTMAVVLSRIQDGEKPVSYASVSLTPEQRKYCTTRQE